MPFKSAKQERWAFTQAGQKALGGKKNVMEWANATLPGSFDTEKPYKPATHISRITKKNAD